MAWPTKRGRNLQVVKRTFQWGPLCPDLRQLVLSKLSLREFALAGPTCQESRQACLTRVAEQRAKLIADAENMCGKRMFSDIVRAIQRALCKLSPVPGLVTKGTPVAVFTEDREPQILTDEENRQRGYAQRTESLLRMYPGNHYLSAEIQPHGPVRTMQFDVYRSKWRYGYGSGVDVQLKVRMSRDVRVAGLGLLLAICTENPEAMQPCLKNPVAVTVSLDGVWRSPEGRRWVKNLAGPLGSLIEGRFTVLPNPPPYGRPTPWSWSKSPLPPRVFGSLVFELW